MSRFLNDLLARPLNLALRGGSLKAQSLFVGQGQNALEVAVCVAQRADRHRAQGGLGDAGGRGTAGGADSDEAGRGFRFEAGHDSDLKPATVPI
jgi:hypothetical protein